MTINGPKFNYDNYLIRPIDKDPNEDPEKRQKNRGAVNWHGHSWAEKEENEAAAPALPAFEKPAPESRGVYGNRLLWERARFYFEKLTTLEEKIAQLCFLESEATYDPDKQMELEELIQKWQIGGLLFVSGDYRRQSYLIEFTQKMSKTPLLMGNSFLHGLSFYFQGTPPASTFEEGGDEKRFSDLGKAVTFQNRSLGIHFQFDREKKVGAAVAFSEAAAKAFRKGVRQATGIVGKERNPIHLSPDASWHSSLELFGSKSGGNVQEVIGLKTLFFLDLSNPSDPAFVESFFQHPYDAVLAKEALPDFITQVAASVRAGKISESEIDRRVLKILVMKMMAKRA